MSTAPARAVPSVGCDPQSVSRSHVGLVRAINEDRVFDCAAARLWAVADGMGGHRGGDLAAQTVVTRLRALVDEGTPLTFAGVEQALAAANAAIVTRNRELGLDAGATVVAALLSGATAQIAWAGDSRAYLLRNGAVTLLTHDHSVVQELIDAGLLNAAQADRHPQANVVTRALGVGGEVMLDTTTVELSAGDRLLLCSDGLSRSLAPDAADPALPLDALADALLAGALARDGSDNASLVVVELAPA